MEPPPTHTHTPANPDPRPPRSPYLTPSPFLPTPGRCVMKDLGLVTALGGAILGSTIVYILPALMALRTSAKNKADGKAPLLGPAETAFNLALLPFGASLALIGAIMTLKGAAH